MAEEQLSVRFEMRATHSWIDRLDDWRGKQKPIPSRAEAIRSLVDKALSADKP
ncbi:hypothetical protein [Novosphingobium pentaromativorans]|uniref:hypothetical protein n=1 Tax=Novosphingobium pentaromativorans TaxID=205844 RepID=UPI001939480A|nr:hypothetical protein [Novosphingobium pentaromativorans]